jgi:hypothetical protein
LAGTLDSHWNKYAQALELSWTELRSRDITIVANHAGGAVRNGAIAIHFFGGEWLVDPIQRSIEKEGRRLDDADAILVTHYLLGCSAATPTGRLISFMEAPGGSSYYDAFKKRSIDRLVSLFGGKPEVLAETGLRLGARMVERGSASISISVLPKLPVTIILWAGDDEVPASANLLFDETAPSILPTEDLAVAAGMVISRLAASARKDSIQQTAHR